MICLFHTIPRTVILSFLLRKELSETLSKPNWTPGNKCTCRLNRYYIIGNLNMVRKVQETTNSVFLIKWRYYWSLFFLIESQCSVSVSIVEHRLHQKEMRWLLKISRLVLSFPKQSWEYFCTQSLLEELIPTCSPIILSRTIM